MDRVLVACLVLQAVCGQRYTNDDELRSEIENAAEESRQLADDLSSMLARLEIGPRDEEVDVEILEENAVLEDSLQEMIQRIENLAKTTEEGNGGSEELEQEEELKDTLLQLETVAKEIEEVAEDSDDSDQQSIQDMTKILKDISERIKTVEEATKRGKKSKTTARKRNGLRKSASLSADSDSDSDSSSSSGNKFTDLLVKFFGPKGKLSGKELSDSDTSLLTAALTGGKKARRPKQLDDGLDDYDEEDYGGDEEDYGGDEEDYGGDEDDYGGDEEDYGGEDEDYPEEDEESPEDKDYPEEEASGPEDGVPRAAAAAEGNAPGEQKKGYSAPVKKEPEEPVETCEDVPQSNRVQICTPDFTNRDSSVTFYSMKPVNSQYCFNVTKTVCEERTHTVSKEICVYDYQQKDVIAPAHLAEVGYQRKLETFSVSKCEKKLVKDGYKEKEIENCYLHPVDVPYRVPAVTERIEDFIELSAPVPEKRCRLVKYDVPQTVCKDTVNKECVTLQSLEKDSVKVELSNVVQDYRGECNYSELEQTTQLCTTVQRVKLPQYNQYNANAYRG